MKKNLIMSLMSFAFAFPTTSSFAQDSITVVNESKTEKEFISKMISLQVFIETYGVDHKDFYPKSVYELNDIVYESEGVSFTTTSKTGEKEKVSKNFAMYEFIPDYIDYREYEKYKDKVKNKIVYQPFFNEKQEVKNYKIFYIDSNGKIYERKNQMFYLSNT